jgi:XTP/dITP diphosphohydrolase
VKLLLATRNAHKLREVGRVLDGIEIDSLGEDVQLPPEDGATYAANALGKARAAARATRRLVVADDSGIEAAALGGRPGVHSARYAGETAGDAENLALLIEQAPAGSPLAYVCVIALVDGGDGRERLFSGRCAGRMAAAPRGERGFGYDPVFMPDDVGDGRTMAELSDEHKDAISHRGRALRRMAEALRPTTG